MMMMMTMQTNENELKELADKLKMQQKVKTMILVEDD